MVKINCDTKDKLKLVDMEPFQGNLKKRTQKDIDELKQSLLTEGLMMPFAIWQKKEGKETHNLLLDGHGRKEALVQMAIDEVSLLDNDWPVIFIQADTEDDARKALLQITSSYGKITKQGVKQFCATIPEYKAPSINKFIAKPVIKKDSIPVSKPKSVVLKIKVDSDKLEQVKEILSQVSFIEVL